MKTLKLEDGKYEIRRHDNGSMDALRHGEPWRDLTGDKLIGAMFDEIENRVPRSARGQDPAEEATGVYACRVDSDLLPGFHDDVFLLWHGRRWSYLGSDQYFRGKVHSYIGPIPRTRE